MKTYEEIFDKFQAAQNAVQKAQLNLIDSKSEKEKEVFQRILDKATEFKDALMWVLM